MRLPLIAAFALPAALSLAACATTAPESGTSAPANSYTAQVERMRTQCEARRGLLLPTGRLTNTPGTDYYCKLLDPSAGPNFPPAGPGAGSPRSN